MLNRPSVRDALEALFAAGGEPMIPAQMAHYEHVLHACTVDQVWDACLTWIKAAHPRAARTDELLDLIFGDGPRPEADWPAPATREERHEMIRADPKIRAYLLDCLPQMVADAEGTTLEALRVSRTMEPL